jgi:O-antigen biosynthesis protein WbqP
LARNVKRTMDVAFVILVGIVAALPALLVALLVRCTSRGPVLYWSDRIGKRNKVFRMPKFRTMRVNTPAVATHLLSDPETWLTPIGGLLRRTSLDELPQLWTIATGDMSVVGPRPALFNQEDLIELRTSVGVDALIPGLTGWAQINGRDDLSIPEKVRLDSEYLHRQSVRFDLAIIVRTITLAFGGHGVSH